MHNISKELKQDFIKSCNEIVKHKGVCDYIACNKCPGAAAYNDLLSCSRNGWASTGSRFFPCEQTLLSAEKWLLKNNKPLTNIYEEE